MSEPCCPHKASEHGDDGCLHGWGGTGHDGCMCMVPGYADESQWRGAR